MFETAELGRTIAKDEFNQLVPELRTDLLQIQQRLKKEPRFPVVVLVHGEDGSGKGGEKSYTFAGQVDGVREFVSGRRAAVEPVLDEPPPFDLPLPSKPCEAVGDKPLAGCYDDCVEAGGTMEECKAKCPGRKG